MNSAAFSPRCDRGLDERQGQQRLAGSRGAEHQNAGPALDPAAEKGIHFL